MTFNFKRSATALLCATTVTISVAALVACSGSSSSSSAASTPTDAAPASLTGTIAGGAAYPKGTTVTVYDKTGAVVATTSTTDDTGGYSISIPVTAKAPLVFAASSPDLDTLYSFSATGAAGNVNITPITNLIAARLSPSGNPENLSADSSQITLDKVAAQIKAVVAVLAPASAATSDSVTNPMTDAFTADGTGHDRLLDALKIKITPTANGANADVTLVNSAASIVIPTFPVSAATTATIPALQNASTGAAIVTGTIAANTMVASGTAIKIKELVARIQACFALPVTDRVAANATTAAHITASACKGLFYSDDPTTYKNNGQLVGKTASWSPLYSAQATGALFDLGKYEFTRPNGDVVLSYRGRAADGSNVKYNMAVAKLTGTAPNEQLKIIGNQYNYDADVGPVVHHRTFVNDPSLNYKSTGYRMYVENKQINGSPAFDRVEVSAPATPAHPNGVQFVLKPNAAYSYLVVVNSDGSLNSSGSVMFNLKAVGNNPQNEDAIIAKTTNDWAWATRADWPDNKISAIAAQTIWTFKYFLANNLTTTPDTIETRRTTARALTIAELGSHKFANYTPTFLAQAQTKSPSTNAWSFIFSNVGLADISADGDLPAWEVPVGAQAPTEINVFGRSPDINGAWTGTTKFQDIGSFGATARKVTVSCTRQSNADVHCGGGAALNTPTTYPIGTRVSYLGLQVFGPNNVRTSIGMSTYKP